MEYAFEGHTAYEEKKMWSDAYKTLGDARRAAKEWVDRRPSRHAVLLQKLPRPIGHEIGAQWKYAGLVKWTT